ncbi:MAG: hypothetical protein IPH81_06370 [Candidatus Microthrix sp.]|nr:hypothetical protein [Candidatus Microthrix sp.]
MLADAHLVLVMERATWPTSTRPSRDAIDHARSRWASSRRCCAQAVPPRQRMPMPPPTQRARRRIALAHQAGIRQHPGRRRSSDVADPMGRWALHYRRTAKQLASLIDASLDGLFPNGSESLAR